MAGRLLVRLLVKTGRLLRHDPASRAYTAAPAPVERRSWLHACGAPVLDQDGINGCTGWTGADWLNHAAALANRVRFWAHFTTRRPRAYLGDEQGKYLYALATRNDDFDWTYPPTDQGSSGLAVAKALKQLGAIDRYEWTFTFTQALGWAQRQPVMLGTLWTESMSTPDANGVIHIGDTADLQQANEQQCGHEYLWRGGNYARGLARIRNHWTPAWGRAGDAYIPFEELEHLIMDWQGDVCVPSLGTAGG